MNAQAQALVEFLVRLPGRRLLDQEHERRPQRSAGREPDASPGPEAATVELRDAPKGVVSPGVAVAGEVADGPENAEDGRARGRAQGRAQVVKQSGPLAAKKAIESRKVLEMCRHGAS